MTYWVTKNDTKFNHDFRDNRRFLNSTSKEAAGCTYEMISRKM